MKPVCPECGVRIAWTPDAYGLDPTEDGGCYWCENCGRKSRDDVEGEDDIPDNYEGLVSFNSMGKHNHGK